MKSKLYKIVFTVYAVGNTKQEAEENALDGLDVWGSETVDVDCNKVNSVDDILPKWRDAIPFGNDQQDRKCVEYC